MLSYGGVAQNAHFSKKVLSDIHSLQNEVSLLFEFEEISQFVPNESSSQIILPNGLRSSKYINIERLEKITTTSEVVSVSII